MFKVGDIVTGLPGSRKEYGITCEDAIMEIVSIERSKWAGLCVKVLSSINARVARDYIGEIFYVQERYFTIYSGKFPTQQTAVERKIAIMYKRFELRNAK